MSQTNMKYFTEDELKCSHCGKSGMDPNFMARIEALREQLGFPFPVNSAYRCPDHPIEARKSKAGAHSTGHAIDIGVRGEKAHTLLDAALEAGLAIVILTIVWDRMTQAYDEKIQEGTEPTKKKK